MHIMRNFSDVLLSNLILVHSTRFENNGASYSTGYYLDYRARGSNAPAHMISHDVEADVNKWRLMSCNTLQ